MEGYLKVENTDFKVGQNVVLHVLWDSYKKKLVSKNQKMLILPG